MKEMSVLQQDNGNSSFIEFKNIYKSYDKKSNVVINNLNLEIKKGEFLSLLGPSGSGKTTCLMLLAGFEEPTNGEILFNGENISNIEPHKRGFGVVFQSYALFPHLTVAENIEYSLKIRKYNKATREKMVADALEMVNMVGYGDRYPNKLSGGQRQRIAMARALVFKPNIVLMDEPLGALDRQLREKMQLELKELHRKVGITFIYVTHDQEEALTMSDRIVVFNDGKVQQIDNGKDLYNNPKNYFVASFIGENNFLNIHNIEKDKNIIQKSLENKNDSQKQNVSVDIGNDIVLKTMIDNNLSFENDNIDNLRVAIRPENIILSKGNINENTFEVYIVDKLYLGDGIKYKCLLGTNGIYIKTSNKEEEYQVNDRVFAHVKQEDIKIFDITVK